LPRLHALTVFIFARRAADRAASGAPLALGGPAAPRCSGRKPGTDGCAVRPVVRAARACG